MKVQARRTPAARRIRTAAAVGAAVAAGTAGLMALVAGTAAADEPGRCNETVNVRAEPDVTSPRVGQCPAGTPVQVGEIREGFLYLNDYQGWVAWEYVSLGDEQATEPPAESAPGSAAAADDEGVNQPSGSARDTQEATTVSPDDSAVEHATGVDTNASDGTPSTTATVPDGS